MSAGLSTVQRAFGTSVSESDNKNYYDTFEVCVGTAREASEVAELVTNAFKEAYPFRRDDKPRLSTSEYEADIKNAKCRWYVLKEKPLGVVASTQRIVAALLFKDEGPKTGFIDIFATHIAYNKKKLGAHLLSEVEKMEKKKEYTLCCVNTSGLLRYYKVRGYQTTGKTGIFDAEYLKHDYIGKITWYEVKKSM